MKSLFCEWFGHDIVSNPEMLTLVCWNIDSEASDSFCCKRCGVGVQDAEASMGRITRVLCRWFGHRVFVMRFGVAPMEDWQETCGRCWKPLGPMGGPSEEEWRAHVATRGWKS
jgi:hypothetical protein